MTNIISRNHPPVNEDRPGAVPNRFLWLQVSGAAIAWLGLRLADVIISWLSCVHQEQYGGPSFHPISRVLFFAFTILLFGLAFLTGVASYRSWRKLSQARDLVQAEASERKEFMALAGLFISLTLGFGIFWLSLPLFLLQMCARVR